MKIDYTIRLETENDYRAVENLTREAFWNVYRPGCLEHYVLHKFRDRADFVHQLSFVLEKNGKIIGHIMYAHSQIQCDNGEIIPIMTFGPLSILPEEQGKDYGTILLQYSMDKAKELEVKALAITGNINFYKKSGFVIAKNKGVRYADDLDAEYFLIKELQNGFLENISGTYKDPDGYFVDEEEVENFDKTFPYKEKLKTDTQLF